MAGEARLPYGWAVDDVIRMAAHVAREPRYRLVRYDEARSIAAEAIVAMLYAATSPPSAGRLFDGARSALGRERDAVARDLGYDTRRTGQPARYYWAFWITPGAESLEDRITDRLAVWQVWGGLGERDRETLHALAACGDYQSAADAIGCTLAAYYIRIRSARRRARELWYWPEPAVPQWGSDIRRRTTGRPHRTVMQSRRRAAA